ncbi:MAG: hypothetical protein R3B45_01565 [Bdellovibrionota bacterium]
MNSFNRHITILTLATLFTTSCRTTESQLKDSDPVQRSPGLLPSPHSNNAWGGDDSSKWQPEAVYANAISDFINRLWTMQSVQDVLVSIPLTFLDSGINPYGDGQTNARVTFNSAWTKKSAPFRSGLIRKFDGTSIIVFEFSPELSLTQTKIEIAYRDSQGASKAIVLDADSGANGWLTSTWSSIPQDMYWGKSVDVMAAGDGSASSYTFFVRPSPNFNDWFPVTFKHPWTTISKITETVPAELKAFKDSSGAPLPSNLTDPMNFAQKADQDPLPFDLAYDLGMQQKWPKAFIPTDIPYFPACNVHGNFKKLDHPENPDSSQYDPTSVGRNWTWVADPNGGYAGADTVPFKILYTCFEERRLHHPVEKDLDCSGLARNSEEEAGVPSGSGWHKIGDPAETLFNSLERVPLLVAAGFERPSERSGNLPPSGTYAYGLKDVATARWLWPGEAFLTANSEKDSSGHEVKNFHWFLFHADRETCTVEWVHPKRPDDSSVAKF